MSLSCDPLSFMHWAVTVPLKLQWPIMERLKLNKEVDVAFSEWAQGLLKTSLSLYEIEKFRRVCTSIWKDYYYMKEEEELLLLLYGT